MKIKVVGHNTNPGRVVYEADSFIETHNHGLRILKEGTVVAIYPPGEWIVAYKEGALAR